MAEIFYIRNQVDANAARRIIDKAATLLNRWETADVGWFAFVQQGTTITHTAVTPGVSGGADISGADTVWLTGALADAPPGDATFSAGPGQDTYRITRTFADSNTQVTISDNQTSSIFILHAGATITKVRSDTAANTYALTFESGGTLIIQNPAGGAGALRFRVGDEGDLTENLLAWQQFLTTIGYNVDGAATQTLAKPYTHNIAPGFSLDAFPVVTVRDTPEPDRSFTSRTGMFLGIDSPGDTLTYNVEGGTVTRGFVEGFTHSINDPYGVFYYNENSGAWEFRVNARAVDALEGNERHTANFTVTVTDEEGAVSEPGVLTIEFLGSGERVPANVFWIRTGPNGLGDINAAGARLFPDAAPMTTQEWAASQNAGQWAGWYDIREQRGKIVASFLSIPSATQDQRNTFRLLQEQFLDYPASAELNDTFYLTDTVPNGTKAIGFDRVDTYVITQSFSALTSDTTVQVIDNRERSTFLFEPRVLIRGIEIPKSPPNTLDIYFGREIVNPADGSVTISDDEVVLRISHTNFGHRFKLNEDARELNQQQFLEAIGYEAPPASQQSKLVLLDTPYRIKEDGPFNFFYISDLADVNAARMRLDAGAVPLEAWSGEAGWHGFRVLGDGSIVFYPLSRADKSGEDNIFLDENIPDNFTINNFGTDRDSAVIKKDTFRVTKEFVAAGLNVTLNESADFIVFDPGITIIEAEIFEGLRGFEAVRFSFKQPGVEDGTASITIHLSTTFLYIFREEQYGFERFDRIPRGRDHLLETIGYDLGNKATEGAQTLPRPFLVNHIPTLDDIPPFTVANTRARDEEFPHPSGMFMAEDSGGDPLTFIINNALAANNRAGFTHRVETFYGTLFYHNKTGAWEFDVRDEVVDGLIRGEREVLTLNVIVTDHTGETAEKPLTITFTGTEQPVSSTRHFVYIRTGAQALADVNTARGLIDPDAPPLTEWDDVAGAGYYGFNSRGTHFTGGPAGNSNTHIMGPDVIWLTEALKGQKTVFGWPQNPNTDTYRVTKGFAELAASDATTSIGIADSVGQNTFAFDPGVIITYVSASSGGIGIGFGAGSDTPFFMWNTVIPARFQLGRHGPFLTREEFLTELGYEIGGPMGQTLTPPYVVNDPPILEDIPIIVIADSNAPYEAFTDPRGEFRASDTEGDSFIFSVAGAERTNIGDFTHRVVATYGTLYYNENRGEYSALKEAYNQNRAAWQFAVDDAAVNDLKGGQVREITFEVTASDGRLTSQIKPFTITITGADEHSGVFYIRGNNLEDMNAARRILDADATVLTEWNGAAGWYRLELIGTNIIATPVAEANLSGDDTIWLTGALTRLVADGNTARQNLFGGLDHKNPLDERGADTYRITTDFNSEYGKHSTDRTISIVDREGPNTYIFDVGFTFIDVDFFAPRILSFEFKSDTDRGAAIVIQNVDDDIFKLGAHGPGLTKDEFLTKIGYVDNDTAVTYTVKEPGPFDFFYIRDLDDANAARTMLNTGLRPSLDAAFLNARGEAVAGWYGLRQSDGAIIAATTEADLDGADTIWITAALHSKITAIDTFPNNSSDDPARANGGDDTYIIGTAFAHTASSAVGTISDNMGLNTFIFEEGVRIKSINVPSDSPNTMRIGFAAGDDGGEDNTLAIAHTDTEMARFKFGAAGEALTRAQFLAVLEYNPPDTTTRQVFDPVYVVGNPPSHDIFYITNLADANAALTTLDAGATPLTKWGGEAGWYILNSSNIVSSTVLGETTNINGADTVWLTAALGGVAPIPAFTNNDGADTYRITTGFAAALEGRVVIDDDSNQLSDEKITAILEGRLTPDGDSNAANTYIFDDGVHIKAARLWYEEGVGNIAISFDDTTGYPNRLIIRHTEGALFQLGADGAVLTQSQFLGRIGYLIDPPDGSDDIQNLDHMVGDGDGNPASTTDRVKIPVPQAQVFSEVQIPTGEITTAPIFYLRHYADLEAAHGILNPDKAATRGTFAGNDAGWYSVLLNRDNVYAYGVIVASDAAPHVHVSGANRVYLMASLVDFNSPAPYSAEGGADTYTITEGFADVADTDTALIIDDSQGRSVFVFELGVRITAVTYMGAPGHTLTLSFAKGGDAPLTIRNTDLAVFKLGPAAPQLTVQEFLTAIGYDTGGDDEQTLTKPHTVINEAPVLTGLVNDKIPGGMIADTTERGEAFADLNGTFTATDTEGDPFTFGVDGSTKTTESGFTHQVVHTYGTLFYNENSGDWKFDPDDLSVDRLADSAVEEVAFAVTAIGHDGRPSAAKNVTITISGSDEPGDDTIFIEPEIGRASVVIHGVKFTANRPGTDGNNIRIFVADGNNVNNANNAEFRNSVGNGFTDHFTLLLAAEEIEQSDLVGIWNDNPNAYAYAEASIIETLGPVRESDLLADYRGEQKFSGGGARDKDIVVNLDNAEADDLSAHGTLIITDLNGIKSTTAEEGVYGVFTLNANHSWTYQINRNAPQSELAKLITADTATSVEERITITVTDNLDMVQTYDVVIPINIVKITAGTPVFDPDAPSTATLQEIATDGMQTPVEIATITATDPDNGHPVTYSLGVEPVLAGFDIDTNKGKITYSGEAIDLDADGLDEKHFTLTITATATDAGTGTQRTATHALRLTITNTNEAPVFTGGASSTISISIDADDDVDTAVVIHTIRATDPEGEAIIYTLDEASRDAGFAIDDGGVITFNGAAYDLKDPLEVHTLTISATTLNFTTPAKHTLFIIVAPEGVVLPILTATGMGAVDENTTAQTDTGITFAVTQYDSVAVGDFTVAEAGGVESTRFDVVSDGAGGWKLVLLADAGLDYETITLTGGEVLIPLTIKVSNSEGGEPIDSPDVFVEVTVADVAEAPVFAPDAPTTASIAENTDGSRAPIEITTIRATDPEGDAVTYRLASDPANTDFVIADPTTGVITYTGTGLDFETDPTEYTLTITATGTAADGSTLSTDHVMAVNVTPVDEPAMALAFTQRVQSLIANVDVSSGIKIADITITDADGGSFGTLQLTGAGAELFEIRVDGAGMRALWLKAEVTLTPGVLAVRAELADYTTIGADLSLTIGPRDEPPTLMAIDTTLTIDVDKPLVLSTAHLNAIDSDTAASDLTYTVTAITGGAVQIYDGTGWKALAAGSTFTQSQVEAGHVRLNAAGNGYLTVTLSDGANPPTGAETITFLGRVVAEVKGVNIGGAGLDGVLDFSADNTSKTVITGIGNTIIRLGGGNDKIDAGLGDDVIDLTTGGVDVVIYRYKMEGDKAIAWYGGDTIIGFTLGEDKLLLSQVGGDDEGDARASFLTALNTGLVATLATEYIGDNDGDRASLANYNITGIEIHFSQPVLLPGGLLGGAILTITFAAPMAWADSGTPGEDDYAPGFKTTWLTDAASTGAEAFNEGGLLFTNNGAGKAVLMNLLGLDDTDVADPRSVAVGNGDNDVIDIANGLSEAEQGGEWVVFGGSGNDTITLGAGMEEVIYRLAVDDSGTITPADGSDTIGGFTLKTDRITFVDTMGRPATLSNMLGDLTATFTTDGDGDYAGISLTLGSGGESATLQIGFADALDADGLKGALGIGGDLAAIFESGSTTLSASGLVLIDDLFGADNISVVDTLPPELL